MSCIDHGQKGQGLGYGTYRYRGERGTAHRVVYCKAHNLLLADIKGLVVRHTCDNARCINPEHLVLGTHQDNMQARHTRKRTSRGVAMPQAKLTAKQVQFIRKHYVRYSKEWGTVAIAHMLGVSHRTVQSVTSGKAWTHIE